MEVTNELIALWSLAVFLSAAFALLIACVTLTPRIKKPMYILAILGWAVFAFLLNFISYRIRLDNDFVSTVGQCVLLCLFLIPLHKDGKMEVLFLGMTGSLLSNVATFMFCGTTDSVLGAKLNLFYNGSPYTIENILLFMGIKLVVFSIIFLLYTTFLRKKMIEMLDIAGGAMRNYLIAPAVSIAGFYVVNLITNKKGIFPTDSAFLPLYGTICLIFVVEYIQIFASIRWTAEAKRSEAEKERIGADLKVATQIQSDMLPTIFPAFPERTEFDIYASMNPAKEVGGDFYDFFLVDDEHLALVVADVSGKGVPAALFMVIAKTLIKNRIQMGEEPAAALANVNNQLLEGNEAGLFVTVWLAVIDLVNGHVVEVNAGHEKLALKRRDGVYELVKAKHSPAVATIEDMIFKQREFDLEPGDRLYAYSDGVPDQVNEKDELFGPERMLKALNKDKDAEPQKLLKNVKEDIDAFRGEAMQFDDITMLGFHYFGKGGRNA